MGLHGLLQGELYLYLHGFQYLYMLASFCLRNNVSELEGGEPDAWLASHMSACLLLSVITFVTSSFMALD
jgi:hypothetical protein